MCWLRVQAADKVRASSRRLLRFDKQEFFCRPFRLLPLYGIRRDKPGLGILLGWFTRSSTAFALGYHLSGFQPFNSCEFV
jgi:hypothetical protein